MTKSDNDMTMNENDKNIINNDINEKDNNSNDLNETIRSAEIYMESSSQQKFARELRESEAKKKPKMHPIFSAMDRFGDLFILNLLFVLTSLPIITIGASLASLYSVTLKMVRNEETSVKDDYFKAFKQNIKQGTICWIIVLIAGFLLWYQYAILVSSEAKQTGLTIAMALEMLALTFFLPFLFPMVARYENTALNYFKNSFITAIYNLGCFVTVILFWAVPVVLAVLIPELFLYTWYLWLLILFSVIAYACSFSIRDVFEKIEKRQEERNNEK